MTYRSIDTSSPRQPNAPSRALYTFDDYPSSAGGTALSVRIDIRDLARLYAEDTRVAGGYEEDWHTAGSCYVDTAIHNADDALDALTAFQFPSQLKRDAQRAARRLTDVFVDVARLQTLTGLTSGRLDRRKFATIARHVAAGTYDTNVVRPYRRTIPTPSQRPTIAVIASAGNAEMWNDAAYIPRVLTLTLAIAWACEAADLNPYAALVAGHVSLGRAYAEAQQGVLLMAPGRTISPKTYGIALHRDLWRYGQMTLQQADYAGNTRLLAVRRRAMRPDPASCGYAFPCRNGGHGVHWARQILNADLVISIGNITDQDEADIRLSSQFALADAVADIVRQARTLDR